MLLVISPAKSLDYEAPVTIKKHSVPDFMADSALLIEVLKQKTPADLSALMGISDKLAQLNAARYLAWSLECTADNAKQALFALSGDVYVGLDANSLTKDQLEFAQNNLRVLSGLYGLLRPLDLMQAYRLEMGTKLNNPRGRDLYAFWGEIITDALNKQLAEQNSTVLINLASNEYFKSVQPKELKAEVITPIFKDWKNDKYKIISFYAKKARGLMCRYAIVNGINQAERLKAFDYEGYSFNGEMSSQTQWVFIRDHQ